RPRRQRSALYGAQGRTRDRRRRRACRNQPVQRLARSGPREQEALHLLTAREPQQHPLLLRLDTLRQQGQVERAAERDNGLHQRLAAGMAAEWLDEALVDLELVELEALQIGQARIAGAEIVKRE